MKVGLEEFKTLAFIPLHYGSSYLEATIKSIHPFVDKILIVYSDKPTYGHVGNIPNPDTQESLRSITDKFTKIVWWDVSNHWIQNEGTHRSLVYKYVNDQRGKINFDLVLPVDADEIHDPGHLPEMLRQGFLSNYHYHNIRGSQWYHFWKNHNEVNRDGFAPMRLINLNNNVRNTTYLESGKIYHMGYAISREEMEYKLSCHGHKNEISNSWFRDKWLNYERGKTTHLHPASKDVWIETETFNDKIPYV